MMMEFRSPTLWDVSEVSPRKTHRNRWFFLVRLRNLGFKGSKNRRSSWKFETPEVSKRFFPGERGRVRIIDRFWSHKCFASSGDVLFLSHKQRTKLQQTARKTGEEWQRSNYRREVFSMKDSAFLLVKRYEKSWKNRLSMVKPGWIELLRLRTKVLVEQDHHLDSWLVSTAFSGKHVGLATLNRSLTSFFLTWQKNSNFWQKSSIASPTPPNKSLIWREVSRALLFFGGAGVRKGWKNLENTPSWKAVKGIPTKRARVINHTGVFAYLCCPVFFACQELFQSRQLVYLLGHKKASDKTNRKNLEKSEFSESPPQNGKKLHSEAWMVWGFSRWLSKYPSFKRLSFPCVVVVAKFLTTYLHGPRPRSWVKIPNPAILLVTFLGWTPFNPWRIVASNLGRFKGHGLNHLQKSLYLIFAKKKGRIRF